MKSWNESGLNECYLGWSPENDLVVINMTRDSDILSRVNFEGVRDCLLQFAESFGDALRIATTLNSGTRFAIIGSPAHCGKKFPIVLKRA